MYCTINPETGNLVKTSNIGNPCTGKRGALDGGGSRLLMSILRNGNVALSNLRDATVSLSILRNDHVPCHYLLKAHVACH